MERFARFMGFADRDAFAETLLTHLRCVQRHYSRLFEDERTTSPTAPALDFRRGAADERLLAHISELGFKQPVAAAQTLKAWLVGEYRALRAEATREALEGMLPVVLTSLARAENPGQRAQPVRQLPAGRAARWQPCSACCSRTRTSSR